MAWETEKASIENYYADLLILQYRNRPKARATIKLGVDLYLADGLVFDLQNVLDIDKAQGKQLDLIGKILGCNRNIFGFTINKKFFTFEKTGAYGYSDKNALSEGLWKNFNNSTGSAYALTDEDYRLLLKFKALYNLRRGSWAELDELYYRAFGTDVYIINNKNLSVTIIVKPSAAIATQAAQFLGYIDVPVGIGLTISNTNNYYLWTKPIQISGASTVLSAITYGASKYLIVARNGKISTSSDGKEWSAFEQKLSSTVQWMDIVYASSKFVAIGLSGKIEYSSNGTSWNNSSANLGDGWYGITYGASMFVAINTAGKIATSANGTSNWSVTTVSNLGNHDWRAITYDGTNFIAISKTGYKSTSADGTTWSLAVQNANLGNNNWSSLTYDGTNILALSSSGYFSVSTNGGLGWSKAMPNANLANKLNNTLNPDWVSVTNNGTDFIAIDTNGYISYT